MSAPKLSVRTQVSTQLASSVHALSDRHLAILTARSSAGGLKFAPTEKCHRKKGQSGDTNASAPASACNQMDARYFNFMRNGRPIQVGNTFVLQLINPSIPINVINQSLASTCETSIKQAKTRKRCEGFCTCVFGSLRETLFSVTAPHVVCVRVPQTAGGRNRACIFQVYSFRLCQCDLVRSCLSGPQIRSKYNASL